MRIPEDIKAYIKKKNRKPVIKCIITMLALGVFLFLCDESFHYIPTVAKIISYIVILLIPVFAFRLPKLVFDRSWQGVITQIYIDDQPYTAYKDFPESMWAKKTLIAFATVRLDNGEVKTVMLHHGKYNNHFATIIERYSVGNRIIHIRGSNHYQVITSDTTNCIMCGHVCDITNSTCEECGCPLAIK
ncbi:MAG: hypothetical protein IJY41_04280 [Clostridia bacterium]|nr:hypothetical protein [Clostridia bacterium]